MRKERRRLEGGVIFYLIIMQFLLSGDLTDSCRLVRERITSDGFYCQTKRGMNCVIDVKSFNISQQLQEELWGYKDSHLLNQRNPNVQSHLDKRAAGDQQN